MQQAELSILVQIIDPAKLIAAGRQQAIEDGVAGDDETAAEIICSDDYALAIRFLLDRTSAQHLAGMGIEVIDSSCEAA